ncbi:MAG TPA: S41 family peptidase [Candidatus Limiplasma sp.]|nr:S41 family peptidase [Candidatus Limiplasma sp.]HPR77543.1 S41 family peptidase [Candidatus Limiplasma sp.]
MKTLRVFGKVALILALALVLVAGSTLMPSAKSSTQNALEAEDSDTVTLSREEYNRLERYQSLDEIAQVVEQYYYVQPDEDAMLDGAKRGLLAGLGDPYTFYYSPEEYAEMWADDEGEYAGIGIQISVSYETLACTISRIFSDSPAAKAGLLKGDILSKVEDLNVDASTLNSAVAIMRGEVGTTVHVQVIRNGATMDFDVERAVVHVNWVSSCMLDHNVGYILLYEFAGDCAESFQNQLDTLVSQGAKSLIIDLRDNPGGWMESAVKLADIFLPKETVTYLEYRNGEREYYNATDGALSIPMVLMLNENSASSSEILAGALQDYGVATIVGTQSYGKGIVQYVLPLGNNGAGMQLTTALYYTPNGRSIHKIGITPDVKVSMPEGDTTLYEVGDLKDAQLHKAWEVAQQKAAGTFVTAAPTAATELSPEATPGAAASSDSVNEVQAGDLFTFRVS